MSTANVVVATCGFNGYGQVNSHKDLKIINRFVDFYHCDHPEGLHFVSMWSRHFIGDGNTLKIHSGCGQNPTNFQFDSTIKCLAATEDICLILLNNDDLLKVDLLKNVESKLNFLNIESSTENDESQSEIPVLISATLRGFFAISNKNLVYSIPSRIGHLPEGRQPIKLVSGNEHCLALLDNGDVFVWGGGLKGQLGLGELIDIEEPVLLEALAGIKIIDIAAGGWHSCALSEFGDLYVWGWNKKGQLGISTKIKQTIYALPELVDIQNDKGDEEEVHQIDCGSSHTLVLTKSEKLFGTGWTQFGQLADIKSASEYIDKFTEIQGVSGVKRVMCGPWTSTLWSSK